jgi:hypothetical protein
MRQAAIVLFLLGLISSRGILAGEEGAQLAAPPLAAAELSGEGDFRGDRPLALELPALPAGEAYSILVRLAHARALTGEERLEVALGSGDRTLARKLLHCGDPDFHTIACAPGGVLRLDVGGAGAPVPFEGSVRRLALGDESSRAVLECEPNDGPEEATPFRLGQTVFASADDRPFIIALGEDVAAAKAAGEDWFTFNLAGVEPLLAYFTLDTLDREVPLDLAIFRLEDGKPAPYFEGFERYEIERSTRFAGMTKFLARRLEPGTYFLRVRANHPAYQLRSETYPLPPYDPAGEGGRRGAAEKAVRAAMDYIVLKGDAWHANTPRVGGVDERTENVHAETAQCIACHPTHFSTRAELFAAASGYPVRQRQSLLFLTERLYNNPRPFYGHPQAAWARMISASANVLSRLSVILDHFEDHVSGRPRTGVHREVAEYLKLYYEDRRELPGDESNGNRPLVSAFEVAGHSWMVFDEMHRRTADPEYALWRDRVRRLIETDDPKHVADMLDLCYQTIAFSRIDRAAYAGRIRSNVEAILSRQRDDGRWAMELDDESPAAEFQTGLCLYTLALAGVPADEPRVAKAIDLLLSRQHAFGAWYDDADPRNPHPYENFRTPFRETQFAILALSQHFPGPGGGGWDAGFGPAPQALAPYDLPELLARLDALWERPSRRVLDEAAALLAHDEPLVRLAAAEALGRAGDESSILALTRALADGSKLVRRSAAWALRQLGNRGLGKAAVARALRDPLARHGALHVFSQHFRDWVERDDILEVLLGPLLEDPDPFIRMMALRALWQWWYWTPRDEAKEAIEDAYLARMALEDHPWVKTNLIQGFHNLCDENTRYLYNNWIPLLGSAAGRERAVAGHRASSARQARKIAAALAGGGERQVRALLDAVGFFHLRSGTYASRGRFSRIGNDVETIQFYADAALVLADALEPLLASPDAGRRGPALLAAYTLRGTGSEERLAVPYLRALADPDDFTRGVALEFHASFLPRAGLQAEPRLVEVLVELVESGRREAQAAALKLIPSLALPREARPALVAAVRGFLAESGDDLLSEGLRAAAGLPELWKDLGLLQLAAEALRSSSDERLAAAVRLALDADQVAGVPLIRSRLDALFASPEAARRRRLLDLAGAEKRYLGHPRIASLVAESLASGVEESLRRRALDLVRQSSELQANAAVRARLSELARDPSERTRQLAEAAYGGKELALERIDVEAQLDFAFFRERVEPLFFEKGADGNACADCHHNHGILRIETPLEGASPREASRGNYVSALKVVDLAAPERSLLLKKPLGTSDAEGIAGSTAVSHGGERRWEDAASAEYRAVLEWINGGRLDGR